MNTKKRNALVLFLLCLAATAVLAQIYIQYRNKGSVAVYEETETDFIQWMEFNVPYSVLEKAYTYDINSYNSEVELHWIELLAYSTAVNWGNFDGTNLASIDDAANRLLAGETISDITSGISLYDYYYECFKAVLAGFLGEYEVMEENPDNPDELLPVKKYGLKAFSPIAQGYYYAHYRDFGNTRTYGYQRRHLGNDLFGSVGTPIIAIEDGIVEALGWNQYGGWRIGIRSTDGKRYYYYAHLRKDHPYHPLLAEGDRVQAGDVIGYLGMTGYSKKENVNNISTPHLHMGVQIIFDESQKDGGNQIWIDIYTLMEFLEKNKMPVYYDDSSKDYYSSLKINTIPTD